MKSPNVFTRRSFLNASFKASMLAAISTVVGVPPLMQRALAAGGTTGKKILFIWLRGANDALNTVIPIGDFSYGQGIRSTLAVGTDGGLNYAAQGACFDPTAYSDSAGTLRGPDDATFLFSSAIPTGNGFAALHPSLKFLAPIYNAGELAIIHRVGYPNQSRSHFDSQNYWENGTPNNNVVKDGIFYRAVLESGLVGVNTLTGISFQSTLPLILRGSKVAMTNLADVTRYKMMGVPGSAGDDKAVNALNQADKYAFTPKDNREMLQAQYDNFIKTLPLFEGIAADMATPYLDTVNTDGDYPYNLFPTTNAANGGFTRAGGLTDTGKYVIDASSTAYSIFTSLKAAALVLERTDAVIAGLEITGFDTHNAQGTLTGTHPNLLRRIAWALYALKRYFNRPGSQLSWNNVAVMTFSEFGRTTIENSSLGTDHAEAGVMFVAGGAVRGYQAGVRSGVYGCGGASDPVPWITGPANQGNGVDGSMFGVTDRYLKRAVDYRSVFGEIIREHLLGDSDNTRLGRIITGYASESTEHLTGGGVSSIDGTTIMGEVNVV